MTKILYPLFIVLVLTGCQTVIKKEIVTVDKPVPFVPSPPKMPAFVSEVDKLTDEDAAAPGKVAQAYKADMVVLRARDRIHSLILDQYTTASLNFDQVNAEIAKLFKAINDAEAAAVNSMASPSASTLSK